MGSPLPEHPGRGQGETADYRKVRTGSFAEFTLLRAGATGIYAFPADVQGRFTVAGQYTWMPLIPGEQFGMGGQGSLRGFGEREFADDIGLAGSLELYSPNILTFINVPKSQLKALAFYDAGYLERNKPQPGRTSTATQPAPASACAWPSTTISWPVPTMPSWSVAWVGMPREAPAGISRSAYCISRNLTFPRAG